MGFRFLPLQVFRLEITALVDDAVHVEGVADDLVHDAPGVEADLAHVGLADLGNHAAHARCGGQDLHPLHDVVDDAGGVLLGVVGDVLVNQA